VDFVSESYSFANIDGRIVLRATIDRPLNSAHNAFEYLSLYSASISKYVSSVLVSSAREAYCASIRAGVRFLPYLYSFKYYITYSDEVFLSCISVAKLVQEGSVLAQAIESLVFIGNQILPPRLIDHRNVRKHLVLDSEGFPSVVEYVSGAFTFKRVGKKSIAK
jgi:hypothetical protein